MLIFSKNSIFIAYFDPKDFKWIKFLILNIDIDIKGVPELKGGGKWIMDVFSRVLLNVSPIGEWVKKIVKSADVVNRRPPTPNKNGYCDSS